MKITLPSKKPPVAQRKMPGLLFPQIAGLLLGAIIGAGCHHENMETEAAAPKVDGDTVTFETNAPQLSALNIQPAESRNRNSKRLTGRLSWNDDATVRVFTPVAGRVTGIRAGLGDAISEGMTLAEINSPDFGQALANARAAAGNLAAANKAFGRSKDLLEHGAAARKDVEAAEAADVAAQAERDRAYAVLENYGGSDQNSNSIYLLRSPLAGALVEKNINPGQEVRADQMLANATQLCAPLFVISDPTKLWLQLDVSESDLASLQTGQHLRVHSRAFPDKSFDGELQNIGGAFDPVTRTVKVRGLVKNPDKLLKAEMYVTVDLEPEAAAAAPSGVEIPATAVFLKGEKHYVFVQKKPGEFQRLEVATSPEADDRVLVLNGLQPGDRVVTEGCILLQQLLE